MKSQLGGATARLSLFLGNKHGEALTGLTLAVPPCPGFALELGPLPASLEPKKQVRLLGSSAGRHLQCWGIVLGAAWDGASS